VTIGGVNAPVPFAGLVATGEFQINVMVRHRAINRS